MIKDIFKKVAKKIQEQEDAQDQVIPPPPPLRHNHAKPKHQNYPRNPLPPRSLTPPSNRDNRASYASPQSPQISNRQDAPGIVPVANDPYIMPTAQVK